MKKFFKIGEISKLYHIGADSLRYYEELGVLSPRRSESGYRLYSIHDIWRLNVIRDLRELGFGMEQIGQYLEIHNVESTLTLLEEEQKAIQKKIQSLTKLKANVEQRLKTIRAAKNRELETFLLTDYPPRRCFRVSEGYSNEDEMDILIKQLLNADQEHLYLIGNSQIGSAIPLEDARGGAYQGYQAVFIIDQNGDQTLESGTYLSISYRGSCNRNEEFIPKLFDYAERHHLKLTGEILELLWINIHISADVEEHVTELQVRVQK